MGFEKYYLEKNGTYLIHFANNDSLPLNEIREKFSTYGKILSIYARGQPKEMVFITYKNLNETLDAIKNNLRDRSLRLLQHKSKFGEKKNTTLCVQRDGNGYAQTPEFDIREIPSLICDDEKYKLRDTSLATNITIIPAHEVIVANIHLNISIHYILHMFNKYNPLCISFMKTTPKTGIRYCHVYFETQDEAKSTVKEFDSYSLLDKNLIVIRPCKLIEEAPL